MFMGTLQGAYLDKMVGGASSGFLDLVITGERIENCLKNGKIQTALGTYVGAKKPYLRYAKKKEGETNVASISKGKDKAYHEPYYQVAAMTPNQYQQ